MKNILFCLLFVAALTASAQKTLHLRFHDAEVFSDQTNHTFSIVDDDKTIFNQLKLVEYADGSLQVLDAKNMVFYLDEKLEIIDYPVHVQEFYCGTVDDFWVNIIENREFYTLELTTDPIGEDVNTTAVIDSIPKQGVKDICFLTKDKEIQYDGNFYFPHTVIIETEGRQMGLRDAGQTTFYDQIDTSDPFKIKVKKEGLWGYFNRTELKFKVLDDFVFHLAGFELEDGRKGFVDAKGKEYLP